MAGPGRVCTCGRGPRSVCSPGVEGQGTAAAAELRDEANLGLTSRACARSLLGRLSFLVTTSYSAGRKLPPAHIELGNSLAFSSP